MRERSSGFLLSLIGAMLITLLFLAVERDALRPPSRPAGLPALAEWMRDHPADWQAASAITERALDQPTSTRFVLWRSAWRLTKKLAPLRPQAATSFVRSGFFHWYELSPSDRAEVLLASADLLRDRDLFPFIVEPVWQLTADMAFLRRANPGTVEALRRLRDLAAMYGLFAEYRELREEVRSRRLDEFSSELIQLTPVEIIQRLPPDFDRRDERLIKLALDELRRRPLDENPQRGETLERLIAYALRHNLEPLQGLGRVATDPGWVSEPARLRLGARLRGLPDDESSAASSDWTGLCGSDVCIAATRDVTVESPTTLTIPLTVVQTDEVSPYVEVVLDDVPVAEASVDRQASLQIPIARAGRHHLEVRVINPLTRNLMRRRVRIL